MTEEERVHIWLVSNSMTITELDSLVEKIAKVYVDLRRQIAPCYRGITLEGKKLAKWRKLAIKLIEAKIDPVDYVTFVWNHTGQATYVEHLLSDSYIAGYRGDKTEDAARVALELESSLRIFKQKREVEKLSPVEALTACEIASSPLFIWCMAKAYGLDETAAKFEHRARLLLLDSTRKSVYRSAFANLGI